MSQLKLDSHSEGTLALGPIDGNPVLGGMLFVENPR